LEFLPPGSWHKDRKTGIKVSYSSRLNKWPKRTTAENVVKRKPKSSKPKVEKRIPWKMQMECKQWLLSSRH
jgi:hypothetical protein